jgi:hypothetical protein
MGRGLPVLFCYLIAACGTEPSGPAIPAGLWFFEADWGGADNVCNISGSTLSLQRTAGGWTGTLKGGTAECGGIPGEAPTPLTPPDDVLANIRVVGDSISFQFAGGNATVRGRFSAEGMSGLMEVVSSCQCTDETVGGTWSATQP